MGQRPEEFLPKLFGPLRERYEHRPGGYTRVLRTEPLDRDKKHKSDSREYNTGQAESAILELVDGPRDMRFAITARALVKQREKEGEGERSGEGKGNGGAMMMTEILAANIRKVTRFREDGEAQLEREVRRLEAAGRTTTSRRRAIRGQTDGDGAAQQQRRHHEQHAQGDIIEDTAQGHQLINKRR